MKKRNREIIISWFSYGDLCINIKQCHFKAQCYQLNGVTLSDCLLYSFIPFENEESAREIELGLVFYWPLMITKTKENYIFITWLIVRLEQFDGYMFWRTCSNEKDTNSRAGRILCPHSMKLIKKKVFLSVIWRL